MKILKWIIGIVIFILGFICIEQIVEIHLFLSKNESEHTDKNNYHYATQLYEKGGFFANKVAFIASGMESIGINKKKNKKKLYNWLNSYEKNKLLNELRKDNFELAKNYLSKTKYLSDKDRVEIDKDTLISDSKLEKYVFDHIIHKNDKEAFFDFIKRYPNSRLTGEIIPKLYKTVKIGDQTWMAENLDLGDYNARSYDKKNKNFYYDIYDAKEIANKIDGWHLPSDRDWKKLEKFLGISSNELDKFGDRGNIANKLKVENWNNSNNSSKFSALPIGSWDWTASDDGDFGTEKKALFWTSSTSPDYEDWERPIFRAINNNNYSIERNIAHPKYAFYSVRLIKDN